VTDPTTATDPPEPIEPSIRVDTWKDAGGAFWSAMTGKTTLWALGPAVRVTVYPRAMRLGIFAALALLGWIAWQVTKIASDVTFLAIKEGLK